MIGKLILSWVKPVALVSGTGSRHSPAGDAWARMALLLLHPTRLDEKQIQFIIASRQRPHAALSFFFVVVGDEGGCYNE